MAEEQQIQAVDADSAEAAQAEARRAAQAKRRAQQAARDAAILQMVPKDLGVEKNEPWSEGISTNRKKKPPLVAVINECCTGCAGSPVCITYCPVEKCMFWVTDEDSPPFGVIEVDYQLCIGCKKCISKGPDDTFLDGCPWDAIDMEPLPEVEQEIGVTFEF